MPPAPPRPADISLWDHGRTIVKRPQPRGNPQNWVGDADYPPPALRAHDEGTVAFSLYVTETGRVEHCRITTSSGSTLLDNTACNLLKRRARFEPAEDAAGTTLKSTYASRFKWSIPDPPVPLGSWARLTRFTIDAKGIVGRCTTRVAGSVPTQAPHDPPCVKIQQMPVEMAQALRGASKGSVTLHLLEEHRVDGMPLRGRVALPADRIIYRRRLSFTIKPDRFITGCTVVENRGFDYLNRVESICHPRLDYQSWAAQFTTLGATMEVTLVTSGAEPGPPVILIPAVAVSPPAPPPPAPPASPRPRE